MHVHKPDIDTSRFMLTPKQIATGYSKRYNTKSISLEQLEKEFNRFEPIDRSNTVHEKALLELFPGYLLDDCSDADWQLFLAMGRYDSRSQTFVTGCYDNQPLHFKLISYKLRMQNGIKWKTKAKTSPNSTLFIRIYTNSNTIYVIEGHRDALTAVLLGLDFIMAPYAGFKFTNPASLLAEVQDRAIVFLVEDKPAFNCMFKIAQAIKHTTNSIVLTSLEQGRKADLSDLAMKKNSIKEVLDELKNKEFN